MDAPSIARRALHCVSVGAACALAAALVTGCDEPSAQAEPAAEAAQVEKAEAPVEAPAPEVKGQASYKEDAFHLALTAPASAKAGEAVELKVILEAQSGFKVNEEYPLKFQFADVAGVTPSKKTVRKEDAKLQKKSAEIPLSVIIKSAGKHKVSGKLSFSVCTDERCLIEKRDLTVEVNAS